MKLIPPIPLKDRYWRDIMREIERMFNDVLFRPLYKVVDMPMRELRNSAGSLEAAIASGRVWYADGKFHGEFNAAISRELRQMGAKWNAPSKTFTFPFESLSPGISSSIAAAAIRFEAIKKAVLYTLDTLNIASIDNLGNLPDKYTKTIQWMEGDWEKAVRGVTVSPELTAGELNGIAVDYAHDLGRYIRKWTEEAVLELRQDVQTMVHQGIRPKAIADLIQKKYGQSRRKAEFLARQETSLLMASYHSNRMKDVGVQRFRWITANDERVRHDHRILDNKIFFLNDPPIINQKTGARGLPGQDFNCRCQMIAIIE